MQKETEFGGKHLDKAVFDYICNHIPHGSSILELGSGWVTGQLASYYQMYSVEESKQWLDVYESYYIYAPLRNGWYDIDVLQKEVPQLRYACVLVDGPFRRRHRRKMADYIWLFAPDAVYIFDETQYDSISWLMHQVAQQLGHTSCVYEGDHDQFGVAWPKDSSKPI